MISPKVRRKQRGSASSSLTHSRNMDESQPSSEYDKNSSVYTSEQAPLHSRASHGIEHVILHNSEIDGLLECPVCRNPMFPPIQQCPSGHTLCSSCKNKVNNKCPICRKEIGDIRCLALEKLAVSLHLPCMHQIFGCNETLPYYQKMKHEADCIYRPYTCPHPASDCTFTGDISVLLAHLREGHQLDLHTGCSFNHRYVKQDPCSVDTVSWTLTLFYCHGHYFCLHFEAFLLGNEPVYMAFLRFMGEESEARKFNYCIEVGGNGRKMRWHGVPRSIRTHHRTVRDSHDGLIIHRSLALYFSDSETRKELKLRVAGKIWKETK